MENQFEDIVEIVLSRIEDNFFDFFCSNNSRLIEYLEIDWAYPVSITFRRDKHLTNEIEAVIGEVFYLRKI